MNTSTCSARTKTHTAHSIRLWWKSQSSHANNIINSFVFLLCFQHSVRQTKQTTSPGNLKHFIFSPERGAVRSQFALCTKHDTMPPPEHIHWIFLSVAHALSDSGYTQTRTISRGASESNHIVTITPIGIGVQYLAIWNNNEQWFSTTELIL